MCKPGKYNSNKNVEYKQIIIIIILPSMDQWYTEVCVTRPNILGLIHFQKTTYTWKNKNKGTLHGLKMSFLWTYYVTAYVS